MPIRKPFRLTPQRQALLEALCSRRWHPTADDLYAVIRERLPRISLGTVYRNLERMAAQGLIRQLDTGGHQKRYDGAAEPHYHVRCLGCGRLDDIQVTAEQDLRHLVHPPAGYLVTGYLLEFIGLCPQCQTRKEKEREHDQFEGNQDREEPADFVRR